MSAQPFPKAAASPVVAVFDLDGTITSTETLFRFLVFALGWARFPDGAEVVYLYDKHDGCFGYALNLTYPDCSEWGYAPFERTPRPACWA